MSQLETTTAALNEHHHTHLANLRTCDFDSEGGPLECEEEDWDGVSVWLGRIPPGCLEAAQVDDDSSTMPPPDATHAAGALVGALADELAARGQGLDESLTIACLRPEQLSWALVTFRQKEDAEALVKGEGEAVAAPLVKRAINAAQAWQDMAEDARLKQEEQDRTVLAVSRIQSWLKRSGKNLNDLFAEIDEDGSGAFDVSEFRSGMLAIGLTFDDATLQALMGYMDSDGGGEIDTEEFISKMDTFSQEQAHSPLQVLSLVCKHMDKSGDTVDKIFKRMDDNTSNVSASPSKPHSQRESWLLTSLEPFSPNLGGSSRRPARHSALALGRRTHCAGYMPLPCAQWPIPLRSPGPGRALRTCACPSFMPG